MIGGTSIDDLETSSYLHGTTQVEIDKARIEKRITSETDLLVDFSIILLQGMPTASRQKHDV